ncbi:hypothetical protein TRVA0_005S03994 [Trichomonascus vanleenenianus]|uniref:uncharacterized protein n=1 Tax=Trichomonascus vanleenenianus TaxID=2268995 RepID=UPI003ECB7CE1
MPFELSASDVNSLWPGWYADDSGPGVYLYEYLAQLAASDTKNTTVNCLCQSGYKCSCDAQHSYSYFKNLPASKRTFVNGKYPEEYVYTVQLVINGTEPERTTASVPKQTPSQVETSPCSCEEEPTSTKVLSTVITTVPCPSVATTTATAIVVWWAAAPSTFNGAGSDFGNVYSTTAQEWAGNNGQWDPSKPGYGGVAATTNAEAAGATQAPNEPAAPQASTLVTAVGSISSGRGPRGVLGMSTGASAEGGADALQYSCGAVLLAFLISWI